MRSILSIVFTKEIAPLTIKDLISKYNVIARAFCDGHLAPGYYSFVTPDNNIVLDLDNMPNMVFGIQTLCHEYCHVLRAWQAENLGGIYREVHEFYQKQCYEYKSHAFDTPTQKLLLYKYSLLELDARAFAETFGTEYTDHYFSKRSLSDLQEAYASGDISQVQTAVLRYLTNSDRKNFFEDLRLVENELLTVSRS